MPILILQCAMFDKALVVSVLHQDDVIRRGNFTFQSSNGFIIKSSSSPELNDARLYIRGDSYSSDNAIAQLRFYDNFQRDLYLNSIQVAVGELNQHYKATGKPTPPLAAPVGAITIVG